MPISHGEGRYYADDATLTTLDEEGRVLFRYCAEDGAVSPEANPNGSLERHSRHHEPRGERVGDDAPP